MILRTLLAFLLSITSIRTGTCPTAAALSFLGFSLSEQTASPTLCTSTYNTGQCVTNLEMTNWAKKYQDFITQKAIDANQFAQLIKYLPIWKDVRTNSTIANLPLSIVEPHTVQELLIAPNGLLDTLWDSTKTTLSTLINQLATYLNNVINRATSDINFCMQKQFIIGTGLMCYLTSKRQSDGGASNTNLRFPGSFASIAVQYSTVGAALVENCLSLVDTFCTLNYGITISSKESLYGTWDSAYTLVPKQVCLDLQKAYGCSTADCKKFMQIKMVDNFYSTVLVPFIPDKSIISAMGLLMYSTAPPGVVSLAYQKWFQDMTNAKVGIEITSSESGEDVYGDGVASQIATPIFFDAWIERGLPLLLALWLLG